MHTAIGYCSSEFRPSEPGRLCRGRERWIQACDSEPVSPIHRLVVSGAHFTDDSARDAQRGLHFSGMDVPSLVHALFPEQTVVAWAEDAHPQQVPESARGLEAYDQAMPRGPLRRWAVRWSQVCQEEEDTREALLAGSDVLLVFSEPPPEAEAVSKSTSMAPMADGFLDAQNQGGLQEALRRLLFLLTGYRVDGPPFRGFQPTALPEILQTEGCHAVILVHQDKHGPCIGIYQADDSSGTLARLEALGIERNSLVVPFAIPPMLARWDRALWELRQDWDTEALGEFPVPQSSDGRSWGRRPQPTPEVEVSETEEAEETADTLTDDELPASALDDTPSADEDADSPMDADDVEDGDEVDDSAGDEDEAEAFPDDDFGDLDDAFAEIPAVENAEDADTEGEPDGEDDEDVEGAADNAEPEKPDAQ